MATIQELIDDYKTKSAAWSNATAVEIACREEQYSAQEALANALKESAKDQIGREIMHLGKPVKIALVAQHWKDGTKLVAHVVRPLQSGGWGKRSQPVDLAWDHERKEWRRLVKLAGSNVAFEGDAS